MRPIIYGAIYSFAILGVLALGFVILVMARPTTLHLFGFKEVSSNLYACMTYQDQDLLEKIYSGQIDLKQARQQAGDQQADTAEYTACLESIFGQHTVWVNTNAFIIYD